MLTIPLDIPAKSDFLASDTTFEMSVENHLIYATQPKNKVFNSTKLDIPRIKSLSEKFVADLQKYSEIFLSKRRPIKNLMVLRNVVEAFANCTANLLLIEPEKLGVEVTSSKTIYFFSKKGNTKIHLEIFFDHELKNGPYECVLNAFDQNGPIINVSGNSTHIFNSLKNLFPDENRGNYLSYIENHSSNGISTGYLTEDRF